MAALLYLQRKKGNPLQVPLAVLSGTQVITCRSAIKIIAMWRAGNASCDKSQLDIARGTGMGGQRCARITHALVYCLSDMLTNYLVVAVCSVKGANIDQAVTEHLC